MHSRALRAICFAAFAALLSAVAIRNAHALNPDAVAYIRIAEYFRAGNLRLAVSGYWSPLLSWLIALLLQLDMAPLFAARLAMALSAIVYVVGCDAVLRRARLGWMRYAGVSTGCRSGKKSVAKAATSKLVFAGIFRTDGLKGKVASSFFCRGVIASSLKSPSVSELVCTPFVGMSKRNPNSRTP